MHPRQSASQLIVYLDFKSPYAYLAKDPSWQLEADFDIAIDWRPLTLNIPSYLGSAKVNDAGHVVEENRTPRQWQGVRYAYMDAKRYARLKDVKVYGPKKIWDSSLASIGLLWMRWCRHSLPALARTSTNARWQPTKTASQFPATTYAAFRAAGTNAPW